MPAILREIQREQFVTEDVLEAIEGLIADARAGRVTSMFCVADYGPDGEIARVSSFNDRLRSLGALEHLKDSINKTGN